MKLSASETFRPFVDFEGDRIDLVASEVSAPHNFEAASANVLGLLNCKLVSDLRPDLESYFPRRFDDLFQIILDLLAEQLDPEALTMIDDLWPTLDLSYLLFHLRFKVAPAGMNSEHRRAVIGSPHRPDGADLNEERFVRTAL